MRVYKHVLVALLGVITATTVAVILGLIEVYRGFALYSFMLWVIIPVGSVITGADSAVGYYLGAKKFNLQPSGSILVNILVFALASFLIIHYVTYYMIKVDNIPLRDIVSFWSFLDIDIRSTSLSLLRRPGVSSGELGAWGYAYAGWQLVGFLFGSYMIFDALSSIPYCRRCSKYTKETGEQKRFTSDSDVFQDYRKNFDDFLACGKVQDAVDYHTASMGADQKEGDCFRSTVTVSACPDCNESHLQITLAKMDDKDWADIPKTEVKMFTQEQLNLTKPKYDAPVS